VILREKPETHTSGAEARVDFIGFIPGINPRPTTLMSFSGVCEALTYSYGIYGTAEVVPFQNVDVLRGSLNLDRCGFVVNSEA
jgi:hypothetical protein